MARASVLDAGNLESTGLCACSDCVGQRISEPTFAARADQPDGRVNGWESRDSHSFRWMVLADSDGKRNCDPRERAGNHGATFYGRTGARGPADRFILGTACFPK